MIKDYELMMIFSPKLSAEKADAANEAALTILREAGAEIIKTDAWGKRMLAYPIDKHLEAYYYVNYMKMDSLAVKAIKQQFNINENVIRHMFVARDEK
ncbi:MAG: 30S ribosomal protein S6 [Candidatus Cloacimonadales bacterium]|jgi:small subunit ribosomal protein S6|nr:30S ribosomal protein S6 [Candidatus Cloacimonadota bacterium]MDY0380890.1 30S ribosomal protein S6 [Candidatus Cloacimonadaceae bacterium]MCB5256345.1 30S ribosomal protein S6 [Candidatus Cloacimonadota bacterium]MCB5263473.1 30S ribosomal protein S6 [Candidatus Cloacimonadota bacterium]MCB5276280.1 30S ribosomal protein S6 [Candidatus Cloacimonadota bacterium]